jgi:pSer/pThr/pTyr-binding forkhead associated (FHA) protein
MLNHGKEIAHRSERRTEQPDRKGFVTRNQETDVPQPELILLPTTDLSLRNEPLAICINRFPCVIGRSDRCDERLDNLMISRRHCVFSLRDGQVWVEDLASRNGTRLNGERLTVAQPVAEGDSLQLAQLAFQVLLQKASIPPPVTTQPPTRPPGTAQRADQVLVAQDGRNN